MLAWIKAMLRDHFGFSKAETNGTLVLLVLMIACLIVPWGLKQYYSTQPGHDYNQDIALLERTLALLEAQKQPSPKPQKSKSTHHKPTSKPAVTKSQQPAPFDINIAHAAQLKTIRGIGSVLSTRIVKFRNKLGGFVHPAQYQEVYGLKPEVIERLKKSTYIDTSFCPTQIDINAADAKTLATHPYCTDAQARSIVHYRTQHGPFLTLKALKDSGLMDEATLTKLKPYLKVSAE